MAVSADMVEFLKKKFMVELEEAEGEYHLPPDHFIPLLPYFQQIRGVLEQQPTRNIIMQASTPNIRIMKECLYDLSAALTSCILFLEKRITKMMKKDSSTSSSSSSKKQEKEKEIKDQDKGLGRYSLPELWFLWKTKRKLIRINNKLLMLVEEQSSVPVVSDVATTSLSFDGPPKENQKKHGPPRAHFRMIEKLVLGTSTDEEYKDHNISKEIGIVGIGGCGKTAVTVSVFHRMDHVFDYRIWINLGGILKGEIDFKEILKAILKQCGDHHLMMIDDSVDQVEELLLKTLQEALRGKSYLIVFDGVWDIKLDWYLRLKETLLLQCRRRIIMITTRLDVVAKRMVGPNNLFRIPPVSHVEGIWKLISYNDFGTGTVISLPMEHPIIVKMKDEILYHSHGLLLSTRIFNTILFKHTYGEDLKHLLELEEKGELHEVYIAINPRDDTNRGEDLLLSLLSINDDMVRDISPGAQFEFSNFLNISKGKSERWRLVILGGDATTNRLLQAVSDMELHPAPSIAVMPLGTQVNISISLGWGNQLSYTYSKLTFLLSKSQEAEEVLIDSWNFVMKISILDNFEIPDTLHVQHINEEDLLHMGGDLCGRFWNYFIIGLDAQDWFGSSHFKFWPRNIILPIRVKIKDRQNEWKKLNLPRSIRSIVCLNMPSFPGGLDPWGKPNFRRTKERNFTTSFVDDELLEIIGFRDSWHGENFLTLNDHGTRLAQAHQIRFELYKGVAKDIYISFDGTRWKQSTPIDDDNDLIEISYFCKSKMLATSSSKCRHKAKSYSH